jgi:hypothetical protein
MSVAIRSGLKKEGCPFGVLLSGWFLFSDDGMSDASACKQRVRWGCCISARQSRVSSERNSLGTVRNFVSFASSGQSPTDRFVQIPAGKDTGPHHF